ncbi:MAG: helix-turn-helix domain-containing protein [Thermoanaerobaculia bacterium]
MIGSWQEATRLVREAMRKYGLTQTAIASAMGVNPSNLSQWLNGHVEPKLGGFLALLKTAGMTLSDLEPEGPAQGVDGRRGTGTSKKSLRELLAQWIGEQVLEDRLRVQPAEGGQGEAEILARVIELIGAAGSGTQATGHSRSQKPS